MNAPSDKWRVTFVAAPETGCVACERVTAPPDPEIWRDNGGTVCASGYIADGLGWMDLAGTAKFRFDPRNREVTAFALPDVSPDLVRDAYWHAALPVALHFFGCEVLHASAVRTERGVVAFCAVSETGKSTIAGALSARGYRLWADDAVAIESDDANNDSSPIRTMLLPFNLRLRRPSAQYLGAVDDRAVREQPDCEFDTGPLAALCLLERSEELPRDVAIRRLSPDETFVALLPHAFCFSLKDQARKRAMLKFYLKVAMRTPTFSVCFAPGFKRLPAILDAIEEAIPAFAPQLSPGGNVGVGAEPR